MLAAAADCEPCEMITLIVQNLATSSPSRVTATLAADATLHTLHEKIADECSFVPGTFELRDKQGLAYRLTDERADERQIGLEPGITNKCRLTLYGIDGNDPVPTGGSNSTLAAAALGQVALWSSARGEQTVCGPVNRGAGGEAAPNADGYVGLVNQGATCYLSSVLQALYMTPEFRRALYDAGAAEAAARASGAAASASNGTAADGGILRQLQRLFVSLQTSSSQAIDTRDLTRSFGWDASGAPLATPPQLGLHP